MPGGPLYALLVTKPPKLIRMGHFGPFFRQSYALAACDDDNVRYQQPTPPRQTTNEHLYRLVTCESMLHLALMLRLVHLWFCESFCNTTPGAASCSCNDVNAPGLLNCDMTHAWADV